MNTQFKLTREEAEIAVARDVHELRARISALWAFRLNRETANLIHTEEGELWAALGALKELVSDIRTEKDQAA